MWHYWAHCSLWFYLKLSYQYSIWIYKTYGDVDIAKGFVYREKFIGRREHHPDGGLWAVNWVESGARPWRMWKSVHWAQQGWRLPWTKWASWAGHGVQRDGCLKLACEAGTDVDHDSVFRCDHEIWELSSQWLEIKGLTGQAPRRAVWTDTEMAGSGREVRAERQSLQRCMDVVYKLHQQIVLLKGLCWRIGGMLYTHPQTCLPTVAIVFLLGQQLLAFRSILSYI